MNFAGKRVLVVGLGLSGQAAVAFCAARGAVLTAADRRPVEELGTAVQRAERLGAKVFLGEHPDGLFTSQDLIIPSPGVPWNLTALETARQAGVAVAGELEIAAEALLGPTIGITGTNGKTTTTALTGHIFQYAGGAAQLGGNIGTPVLDLVPSSRPDQWNVLELSSFQLEAMTSFRANIAAILNVTPDHLDRHRTLEEYAAAKERLLQTQQPSDHAVLNAGDEMCRAMAARAPAPVTWFRAAGGEPVGAYCADGEIYLDGARIVSADLPVRGAHNLENALAAVAICSLAGLPHQLIGEALQTFQAVEHRLEFVRNVAGVDYFNDSKATNTDAAVKAIEAFEGGLWVILGGSDKGGDFAALAQPLRERASAALLIGASADRIAHDIGDAVPLHRVGTLAEALATARRLAAPGDTVLLAPACASFDQFRNYAHRGDEFKRLVGELQG